MPNETAEETATAYTYPREEVYEQWQTAAVEMGMTTSEYIQAMVAAGRKEFARDSVSPDETAMELREQRNRYKEQLQTARSRIEELEDRVSTGERAAVREFVADNPGTTYRDIVNRLIETVRDRAGPLVEQMEGEDIVREDGQYYPTGGEDDE